ncbi:MAG: hypothetical protein MGU50_14130 [Trichodesmium sp. MAG_R02]|jgi:hypothetical protein|nr:hypothetical protein [Trichodesmium sp. MAG_R02]
MKFGGESRKLFYSAFLGAPSLGVELILILNSAVNQENYCKRLAKEKVRN